MQLYFETRGPRGHCRSPENNKRIKKLTSEWNKLEPQGALIAPEYNKHFSYVRFLSKLESTITIFVISVQKVNKRPKSLNLGRLSEILGGYKLSLVG